MFCDLLTILRPSRRLLVSPRGRPLRSLPKPRVARTSFAGQDWLSFEVGRPDRVLATGEGRKHFSYFLGGSSWVSFTYEVLVENSFLWFHS